MDALNFLQARRGVPLQNRVAAHSFRRLRAGPFRKAAAALLSGEAMTATPAFKRALGVAAFFAGATLLAAPAYAQAAGAPGTGGIGDILANPLFMLVPMGLLLYFLILRPQQQR